jgi:hypothetical protein
MLIAAYGPESAQVRNLDKQIGRLSGALPEGGREGCPGVGGERQRPALAVLGVPHRCAVAAGYFDARPAIAV